VIGACLAVLLALVPASQLTAAALESGGAEFDALAAEVAGYLLDTVRTPGIGQTGGDWAVLGLMRCGEPVPDSYRLFYLENAINKLKAENGELSTVKYTEYSRVVIAMAAIGADPRNVGGYDMVAPLLDYDATVYQGINGPIFALIALSCSGHGFEEVTGLYLDYILSRQFENGGFALHGTVADPDTTSMALSALSLYGERDGVADAVGPALARLSRLQRESGGFTSFASTNSESVSQAIIALCSLGVSVSDERFVKEGNSLLDNLMSYYLPGSGFEHELGGGPDVMATEQALCALAALRRQHAGLNAFFDMTDAPAIDTDAPRQGLDGKHPDVSVPPATFPDTSFSDIDRISAEEICSLADRGIITGYPDGSFAPYDTITRAEFAAVIVRALGLEAGANTAGFTDVPDGSWFYDYARTAFGYGLILGRGEGAFDPEGLITRQEAAVMLSRAAALCGLTLSLDEAAVRNILAVYDDYRSVSSWAAEALAFCCFFGIVVVPDMEILPSEQLLRGETGVMVFRLLERSLLI